ncbi:MAG: flagellar basal body P-ring protein FlgI [Melioribacter sp.]|jgi:flagellar P-ring protein precursor FlgI|uniref:flagellar basal body P-ring protein FlgI n=1 Tax=Melioribacter sp. TaxID=2052167 RepID=UPI003BCAC979
MKFKATILLLILMTTLNAQRIKDIAYLNGNDAEQIIGYGLVVGLAGTGDSYRSSFTIQSVTSMLKRFGITVPQQDIRTKNVAAVMVTATLNANLKPGAEFDVTVSSIGDATSLQGGTLLMTPLSGMSGRVYGFAQGPISVGGYDINTFSGNRISKNHSLAGRVPRGGRLKEAVSFPEFYESEVSVYLKEPDITTANNISNAINTTFGGNIAKALDAAEVRVSVPQERQDNLIGFLAELENINVEVDEVARVVLNERTGTVVAGSNVRIQPVSITHGGLNIQIRSYPIISQPNAFSGGETTVFNNLVPYVSQDSSKTIAIQGATNVQEVAAALNSLKVSPRDIIAIFQALKEAGALIAELVIM